MAIARLERLTAEHASAIAGLEEHFHPEPLRQGADDLREALEDATLCGMNHSFGLFDGAALVGYLLCFGLEESSVPLNLRGENRDYVIYIYDLTIVKEYRRQMPGLFNAFVRDVQEFYPGIAVEAESIEENIRKWQAMERWAKKAGYRAMPVMPAADVVDGMSRFLVRWEALEPCPDYKRLISHPAIKAMTQQTYGAGKDTLTVRLMRLPGQMPLIGENWDRLLAETEGGTAFQTLGFQMLYCEHYYVEELSTLLVFDAEERIIGLAPLAITLEKKKLGTFRSLGFIGSRDVANRPVFLFGKNHDRCMTVCIDFLMRHRNWDKIHFYEQVVGKHFDSMLALFRSHGLIVGTMEDFVCPHIRLETTWQEFIGAKSRKFRKNLQTAERKLSAQGELRYHSTNTPEGVAQGMADFAMVESRSSKVLRKITISGDEQGWEFYLAMAEQMSPKGKFVVRTLLLDNKAIAVTFGIYHAGVFYSIHITHDEAYSSASPGTYLESLEMEECFSKDLVSYDFLGGYTSNKKRWTTTAFETREVHVYPRRPLALLIYAWTYWLQPLYERWQEYRDRSKASGGPALQAE